MKRRVIWDHRYRAWRERRPQQFDLYWIYLRGPRMWTQLSEDEIYYFRSDAYLHQQIV